MAHRTYKAAAGVIGLAGLLAVSAAWADETPPSGSKPLLEIVTALEEKKTYAPITDISFDDGYWEVEAYKGAEAVELTVDPKTGEVRGEHPDDRDRKPPEGSMKLSAIIKAVQDAGYTGLNDISFEGKSWEIEATRENSRREIRVDPKTGKVTKDRPERDD